MPVPSSIGTANGYLLKTNKSKGFAFLTKGIKAAEMPQNPKLMSIEDGNATFHVMKKVSATFKQINEKKIFDMSTIGKTDVIFSTDTYETKSIKSLERSSRGSGEKRVIKGGNTRRPEKWKGFLANDQNKQQLIKLLLKVWNGRDFSHKLRNKRVILVCEGNAYLLTM